MKLCAQTGFEDGWNVYGRGSWLQNHHSNRESHYLSSLALEFRLLPGARQSLLCIAIKKQTNHNKKKNPETNEHNL